MPSHRQWASELRRRLREPLPGATAAACYGPHPHDGRHYNAPVHGTRQAAVLVLLYPRDDAWHIPLAVRTSTMLHHAGQICLPGGVLERGETPEDAALREFHEEVGASAASIDLLGRLTPLSTHVSRFWIQPVVGVTFDRPEWRLATEEVAALLETPLAALLDPRALKQPAPASTALQAEGDHDIAAQHPHIEYDGRRIWGVTCMILGELLAVVRELDRCDHQKPAGNQDSFHPAGSTGLASLDTSQPA